MSPQNLSEDLLELLGQNGLPTLHLHQTEHSPTGMVSLRPKYWISTVKQNSALRVYLSLDAGRGERELVWQEEAPVAAVLYNNPYSKMEGNLLIQAIEWYRDTLKVFGYLGLPKFSPPKSFEDRSDPFLFMLVKECPNLHTLIIRERISTCTLLIIAEEGKKKLRDLIVRRNAVIMRFDWPEKAEWSKDYCHWLKKTSQSYTETEEAIGKMFGKAWNMLSDKDFLALNPTLY